MTLPFHVVARQLKAIAGVGKLVPFVGAGLSRPLCRGWVDFLDKLSAGLGIGGTVPQLSRNQDDLYRIADRAAFALRLLPEDQQRKSLAEALLCEENCSTGHSLPRQAAALAEGYWPIIITTNYDDVLLAALHAKQERNQVGLADDQGLFHPIWLLGRSQADCETILRALDANHPRMIWHIQGNVGSVLPERIPRLRATGNLQTLLDEVVVGHQQYQRAANQNPTFRRTFAELFRRRSILFIGSGLTEGYFINLISEIILNFGPSPHPHFAMFSQKELKDIDPEFLEVRLGITAVEYGQDHDRLPDALLEISAATQYSDLHRHAISTPRPLAMCYGVPRDGGPAAQPKLVECSLRFAHLSKPGSRECVVLSVGLAPTAAGFQPKLGSQAKSFLAAHYPNLRDFGPSNVGQVGGRLLRVIDAGQELPVFLLGAREIRDTRADRRSLSEIGSATVEALTLIEQLGEFCTVSMGLLAAGDRSFAHPMFAFIAQFSGIRRFTLEQPPPSDGGLDLIELRIVDPSVIAPILEGRLPIQELLSSDIIRVLVRVYDHSSHSEAYTVSVSCEATVEQVLAPYGLSRDDIDIRVAPLPYPSFTDALRAPVFPTMTIDVSPRAAARPSSNRGLSAR
jgi:hypothetical protein